EACDSPQKLAVGDRKLPPAQRAGRSQPGAEAEGRCPGVNARIFTGGGSSFGSGSLGLSGRRGRGLLTQGVGLRPRPWAVLSRPVGPHGSVTDISEEAP